MAERGISRLHLFFSLFSYEYWGTNTHKKFGSSWRKLLHKHLKCFSKCMEISVAHVFEGHKSFKERWKINPGARGLQWTLKEIRQVVCGNCQLTVSQLGMKKKVFGRLSPKIWVCEKPVQNWYQNCWRMIRRCTSGVFKLNQTWFIVITGDETWIFEYTENSGNL